MATTAHDVIGRAEELAVLDGVLSALANGPSGCVLDGPPGVGKTTLWLAGGEEARRRGYRVLTTRPAEAEARFAFAGLGDLLEPELEEVLDGLPAPQANALRIALLLEQPGATPPDERSVAVAVLGSLRLLAAETPLVVAIDDLQWLDSTSALVLSFAWRRIHDERVGLLVARRSGEPVPAALVEDGPVRLDVRPLSLGAVHSLLRSRIGLSLPRPALRRIYDVAAGNAFFALELGSALQRLGATPAPGEELPVPDELQALVRDRIDALPAETRSALAAAAAVAHPTTALLAGAGHGDDALGPAFDAQVLERDGDGVRFTHPLLAAAAYADLDAESQRRLHGVLADLVDDGEERARHHALATDGPDAGVAAELEHASHRARRRGATSAAAELAERALGLTPDADRAALQRRRVAAALFSFDSGDPERAVVLLDGALADAETGGERAEALAVLSRIHRYQGDQPHAATLARRALEEPEAGDLMRAEAAQALAATLFFLREELDEAVRFAALAAELATRAGDEQVALEALCVQGLLECLVGRTDSRRTLQRAVGLGDTSGFGRILSSAPWNLAVHALWTDDPAAPELLRSCLEDAVERGDEGSAPMGLAQLAQAEYLAGRWQEAERVAGEGLEISQQAGQRPMEAYSVATRGLVRASLGVEDEARADAGRALALAGERGMAAARIHGVWALGILELSLGHADEVVRLLAPERERLLVAGVGEPGTIRFVPDEIEALVLLGRLDEAEAVLAWLSERAGSLARTSALVAAARCEGLLHAGRGEGDAALAAFERGLAVPGIAAIPFEQARTLLALGAAQRRSKRKAQARATLQQALAAFEKLGAALWAANARTELGSIGGRAPSESGLTPAETRVAALVAEGKTNREVAAALFVTEHTVEFHLSGIYRKLGIRSRAELARQSGGSTGKP